MCFASVSYVRFLSLYNGVLAMGATSVIVPDRFSPDQIMEAVRRYGVAHVPVVPPVLGDVDKERTHSRRS
jgi:acyl-coenzyme A synthetase/AMP-(fatty) acid ligase